MGRIETDSMGEMKLPEDVYYGIQTARALKNFPVSGITERPEFIEAYVLIKKAAALVNMELEELGRERGEAIIRAADEVLEGTLRDEFVVDVFQAGAGTSFNMNVNEVLANRALEILGRKKGEYSYLSPNDHVNKAQSTNDTFPTAAHIAVIKTSGKLLDMLDGLAQALRMKGNKFEDVVKSGRTHLKDAMPVTLGAEFTAYAAAIERAVERINQRREDLRELAIGGTATGTGANAHPDYRSRMIDVLSKLTGERYCPARDSFEALQSRSHLAAFSSALKELAFELIRIANDLRLLSSGPTTGLAEIKLPPVQPGSSAMPGKVNPVMAECLNMICFQVVGADTAVSLAAQAGQLDLNVMTPVIIYNILTSISLLVNFLPGFVSRCIEGIEEDSRRCLSYVNLNPSLATLLISKIGYLAAAELAKEAEEKKIPVRELALSKGILEKKEAEELFNIKKISRRM